MVDYLVTLQTANAKGSLLVQLIVCTGPAYLGASQLKWEMFIIVVVERVSSIACSANNGSTNSCELTNPSHNMCGFRSSSKAVQFTVRPTFDD